MANPNRNIAVSDFILSHREIPPEKNGWFNMPGIQRDMRDELGVGLTLTGLSLIVDHLLKQQPPVIEISTSPTGTDGQMIAREILEHPDDVFPSLYYYRALGSAPVGDVVL